MLPSTGRVKFAVIEVALVNVTELAVTIAPVDELIASTKGTEIKICTSDNYVCCIIIYNTWTDR